MIVTCWTALGSAGRCGTELDSASGCGTVLESASKHGVGTMALYSTITLVT